MNTTDKKIYFASDLHLGFPDFSSSLEREKIFVQWLDKAAVDASAIYLLGDIFDFWFEFSKVVPRGFTRLLGKISEITDSGIPVYFFTGNHDLWVFDYFQKETGVTLFKDSQKIILHGKTFFMAHGDGLGPGDNGYKFMRYLFKSSVCQWLFARLHPNFTMRIGQSWSKHSRLSQNPAEYVYKGEDKEWLIQFSKEILRKEHIDFFIFGHRHIMVDIKIGESSRFINLGDWINNFSYAVFDGKEMNLLKYSG